MWIWIKQVYTRWLGTQMNVGYQAQPFVAGPASTKVDLRPMNVTYNGHPFVTYWKN
jgi:hypothetical protein